MSEYMYDVECYVNYFEVKYLSLTTFKIYKCRLYNDVLTGDFESRQQLHKFMLDKKKTFIGFNSGGYDNVILTGFISGKSNGQMKTMSNDIIVKRVPWWNVYKKHNLRRQILEKMNHIDICQPAPSVQTSLKLYAGRLGAPKMQGLPIDPEEVLNDEQVEGLSTYCDNDLHNTRLLYEAIRDDIELRAELSEKYGVDLLSKSSPQMAEAIFKVYLEEHGVDVGKRQTKVKPFKYRVPEWVSFESDVFNSVLDTIRECEFTVSDKGVLKLPNEISKAIPFDGAKYKFGIGGLHSQEKGQTIFPSEGENLSEFDVASLYPSIIIEQELYPLHLGEDFLTIYTSFRDQRMASKAEVSRLKREIALLEAETSL